MSRKKDNAALKNPSVENQIPIGGEWKGGDGGVGGRGGGADGGARREEEEEEGVMVSTSSLVTLMI